MLAATTVPIWATLLTGLAGGVLGALITTVSNRGEERRTRMLDAADDFLLKSTQMSNSARDIETALENNEPGDDGLGKDLDRFADQYDALNLTIPRVFLLFGKGSASNWAVEIVARWAKYLAEYGEWRNGDSVARERVAALDESESIGLGMFKFAKAARREVRLGIFARFGPW